MKEAAQRDEELRDAWVRKIAQWSPEQVIFLDESGVNARSGERTRGWGPKGQIIPYPVHFRKCTNFSILPAMTVDGYIACQVYSGGVNADTFKVFVENQLLPLCNEFPGPNSIIVIDNASIHKSPVYPTIVIE